MIKMFIYWSNLRHGEEIIKCFICGEIFKNKRDMMNHRKREHKTFVRDCNLFIEGQCRYKEESCLFNHSETVIEEVKGDDKQLSESRESGTSIRGEKKETQGENL